ncbi:MAG: replication initiation protein [Bacteroidales bacterium]|nr:replication initiation protein [Candidatus Cacconaster scatequi]
MKKEKDNLSTQASAKQQTRLVQPNNITFSCKNVSAIQYNILVLIVEKIQKHMTKVNLPNIDKVRIPSFSINASEVSGINHKERVVEAAVDMTKINFVFDRLDWAGKQIIGEGPIVTWVDDVKGSNEIRIKLNDMLIPALTYYGKGVGGTYFVKELTLSDSSVYTKQLRQMIQAWRNRNTAIIEPIERIKAMLGVAPSMSNKRMKSDILEPSRRDIVESNPEVWFEYKFVCESPIPGRKPKADHIRFTVYSKDSTDARSKGCYEDFRRTYDCIAALAPGRSVEYTDKITDQGKLNLIASKYNYYLKKCREGEITKSFMENCMRKILAEECGIIIIQSK